MLNTFLIHLFLLIFLTEMQMSSANGLKVHLDDSNYLVPLECVIRTKWQNAIIDWNGTTKIL
jgi:hypothetical protein